MSRRNWYEDDRHNNSQGEASFDYTTAAGLAIGGTVVVFGAVTLARSISKGVKAAQVSAEKISSSAPKFKMPNLNVKENLKNASQNAKNLKKEDFSSENILKNAEKLRNSAKTANIYSNIKNQSGKVDSQKIENIVKQALKDMEQKAGEAQKSESGKKLNSFFSDIEKQFNGMMEERVKLAKEAEAKAAKETKENPSKAPETSKTPKTPSPLDKFLEENFGSLFDKHLQGGFEDMSKAGMSRTEARRILQFEVNGKPPAKQSIMDNYRVLSRKNHPDMGGSAYLSAKINEAKDVLLKDNKKMNRRG